MAQRIASWVSSISKNLYIWLSRPEIRRQFTLDDSLPNKEQDPNFAELARNSQREWKMAYRFFNEVTDPELVDTAIHLISAYEKHYNYLLRQMRHTENTYSRKPG
jgi:hypothetical protein